MGSGWLSMVCQYPDTLVYEYHVVPHEDLRDHENSSGCWCRPNSLEEHPDVFIHNSMDRREEYEEGRPLS